MAGKLLQQVPQLAHGHRLGLFGGERPIQGGDLRIDPVLPQGQARRLGGLPLLPVRGLAGHVFPGGVLLHLAQDRLALGGILSRHRHRGLLRPVQEIFQRLAVGLPQAGDLGGRLHCHHGAKPVHPQLPGGARLYAEVNGGGEVHPAPCRHQEHRQRRCGRCPAQRGPAPAPQAPGDPLPGLGLHRFRGAQLVQGSAHLFIHDCRLLPTGPAGACGTAPAGCRLC